MTKELLGSEAIFGFCAWLTTRKEKTIMSESNDASIVANLIKTFCEENNLTVPRGEWTKYLTMPKN